jgi:hypothetical protein
MQKKRKDLEYGRTWYVADPHSSAFKQAIEPKLIVGMDLLVSNKKTSLLEIFLNSII